MAGKFWRVRGSCSGGFFARGAKDAGRSRVGRGGAHPVMHAHDLIGGIDMRLDRALRYSEHLRDLPVAETSDDKLEDGALSRRQLVPEKFPWWRLDGGRGLIRGQCLLDCEDKLMCG